MAASRAGYEAGRNEEPWMYPFGRKVRFLSNIEFAFQGLRGSKGRQCTHVGQIRDVVPNSEGCGQCVAMSDTWARLGTCMACGQVECCGSPKNGHARKHADVAGHPIARSKEPGEE